MDIKDDLKDLLENGIIIEIFAIDQAIFTNKIIIENSKNLKDLNLNNFFGFFSEFIN